VLGEELLEADPGRKRLEVLPQHRHRPGGTADRVGQLELELNRRLGSAAAGEAAGDHRREEGATTKDAAAALFLSPKTVEFHLGNVYKKLSVKTRSQLVRRVEGIG
jgi:hypothetical protein